MLNKKSLLIMNDSYYPKPSPNGICIKKIIQELIKNEYNIDLITMKNQKEQYIFEKQEYLNIHRLRQGIMTRILLESRNSLFLEIINNIFRIKGAILGFIWPVLSPLIILKYYWKAKKIYKKSNYQAVIGVYKQIEAVLAGVLLKINNPDIKFIVYTLDALSGGHIPTILKNKNIARNSINMWEKLIFNYADKIYIMESHLDYYNSNKYLKYKHKFVVLDIPLLETNNEICSTKNSSKINLTFTGSMSNYTANPKYLIKLLEAINGIEIEFNIYGNISKDIENEIMKSSVYNQKIFIHGFISHNEVKKKQKDADFLVNFGNGNPCMIPSKIFEYMSIGRPIISFTYSERDSSTPYILKYPDHLIINEEEFIERNAIKLIDYLTMNHTKINNNQLRKIFFKNTSNYFIKCLEKDLYGERS